MPPTAVFSPDQVEALGALQEWVSNDNAKQIFRMYGSAGTGKAQPVSSKVLTPRGWSSLGDIVVGDTIIAADGSVCAVDGVFPQGAQEVFKVGFVDGRSATSTGDHLWKFWYDGRWRVKTLAQIASLRSSYTRGERMSIPLPSPYTGDSDVELPIDPYLLGVLLGDGGLNDRGLRVSSVDPFIISEVERLLPEGHTVAKVNGDNVDWHIKTGSRDGRRGRFVKGVRNGICAIIDELGLRLTSERKFVPDMYKNSSYSQRMNLLQGLMDTDGTADKKSGNISFCSISKKLAEDVQYLCWSVGAYARITSRVPSYTHNGVKKQGALSYNVWIRHPDRKSFFRLQRKIDRVSAPYQYADCLRLRFSSIDHIGHEECVCISIDHPDKLYVTDNYIVTHNTTITDEFLTQSGLLPYMPTGYRNGALITAPTGKAAIVMASKLSNFDHTHGRTLHSVFRAPIATLSDTASAADKKLSILNKQITELRAAKAHPNEIKKLLLARGEYVDAVRRGSSLGWGVNNEPDSRNARVMVIDEASMVGSQIALDIFGCGCKVLAIGDPYQLPPPRDTAGLTNVAADAHLTTIHRYAAGGGIASLADMVRRGENLRRYKPEPGGDVVILKRPAVIDNMLTDKAGVILVWRNETRRMLNRKFRRKLGLAEFDHTTPLTSAEKLICIKNNYEYGIMNGTRVQVLDSVWVNGELQADVQAMLDNGTPIGKPQLGVPIWTGALEKTYDPNADDITERIPRYELALDFAHALTVHKSQGSEWDNVIFYDEAYGAGRMSDEEYSRWCYTAITRAKKKLVVYV